MTVSERGPAVAHATTRLRRRTVAANILIAIALLVLLLMTVADWYLITRLNVVTRLFMFGVLVAAGWIPVTLVIIAVRVRPYWATFIALDAVGVAVLTTLVLVWTVPDAPYPYPTTSWPRRG